MKPPVGGPCVPPGTAAGQRIRAGSSVVEHLTFNQMVVGSIPTPLTNDFNGLWFFGFRLELA